MYQINDNNQAVKTNSDEKKKKQIETIKAVFIPFHLLAAVGFSIALVVLIAISQQSLSD